MDRRVGRGGHTGPPQDEQFIDIGTLFGDGGEPEVVSDPHAPDGSLQFWHRTRLPSSGLVWLEQADEALRRGEAAAQAYTAAAERVEECRAARSEGRPYPRVHDDLDIRTVRLR